MNTIKIRYEDLPKQDMSKTSPVLKYCRKLKKEGTSDKTRIEFYRDVRPDNFDFAITNLGKYLKDRPRHDLE